MRPRFMAAGGRIEPLANPTRQYEVPTMPRRLVSTLACRAAARLDQTAVALAAKPHQRVSRRSLGYFLVDVDGWWDITVDGFEIAGIPVYEEDGETFTDEFNDFGAAFGLVDGAGLEAFVRGPQWDAFNKNETPFVCMKAGP